MEDFKDFVHDFGQEYLDENNPDYSVVSMDYFDEFYANHSPLSIAMSIRNEQTEQSSSAFYEKSVTFACFYKKKRKCNRQYF